MYFDNQISHLASGDECNILQKEANKHMVSVQATKVEWVTRRASSCSDRAKAIESMTSRASSSFYLKDVLRFAPSIQATTVPKSSIELFPLE